MIKLKNNIIALLSVQGQYFLPPRQFINWKRIRQILNGEKKLLRVSKIPSLNVPPKVNELTVTNLMSQVRNDPRIMQYLPDTNRAQDRTYFFAVLAAVLPDSYAKVLSIIKDNRTKEVSQEDKIEIIPEMTRLIEANIPYVGKQEKVGSYLNSGCQ